MWAELQNRDEPIIGALEMDAACVVVNLFMLPDEPELFRQCVANIAARPRGMRQIRHAADDRAAGHAAQRGPRRLPGRRRCREDRAAGAARRRDGRRHHQGRPDRATRPISTASSRPPACRCWSAAAARRICAPCSASRRPCSRRARMGLVYGRNIYQHDNPKRVVAALMAMIHRGRLRRRGLGDLPEWLRREAFSSASTPATPSSRRCCSTPRATSSQRASGTARPPRRRPAMSSATWTNSGPTPPR